MSLIDARTFRVWLDIIRFVSKRAYSTRIIYIFMSVFNFFLDRYFEAFSARARGVLRFFTQALISLHHAPFSYAGDIFYSMSSDRRSAGVLRGAKIVWYNISGCAMGRGCTAHGSPGGAYPDITECESFGE